MKNKYILLAFAGLLCACNPFDKAEFKTIVELVPQTNSQTVSVSGGTAEIIVYSSGDVKVEALNDFSQFATLNKTYFKGDDTLRVTFSPNTDYRRMAKLRLELDGGNIVDTLRFLQEGNTQHLSCNMPSAVVDGSISSSLDFVLDTDVDMSQAKLITTYEYGIKDWISELFLGEDLISIKTVPTHSDHISRARIKLEYFDGWGEDMSLNLVVTASDKDGDFGTSMEFGAVKSLAGAGTIAEDYYIKGMIVSDYRSKNLDLNPSVNYNQLDLTESDRTAYLQAEDGSMGLRLKYSDVADNMLTFGTKVILSLQGLRVERDETAECYTVYDVKASNILESIAQQEVTPKVRTIASLSDEDIFTFVQIPNTEFIWKEGCYANVYENYAVTSSINECCTNKNSRFDGWATLLVDDQGSAIYAPINMLCLWRRPGSAVPQGAGNVKGIIVHNTIHRYGDVGRYQIRVLDETGFEQSIYGAGNYATWAEFTGKEYQYRVDKDCWGAINSRYADPGSTRLAAIIPSDDISLQNVNPKAELYTENQSKSSTYPKNGFYCYFAHSSLTVNGDNGKAGDRGRSCSSSYNDGNPCALQLNNDIKGWYQWKNNEIVGYNGLVIRTSTKDITGTNLYFAYAFSVGRISAATSQYFPSHWCVEYSIDGGQNWTLCPDAATGKEYVHLRSLPWWDVNIGGIKYVTCASCGMSSTEHVSMIPDDAIGVEELLLKIRPYDDVMSIFPLQWDGEVENSRVYYNTTADVGINMEYIRIRYKE